MESSLSVNNLIKLLHSNKMSGLFVYKALHIISCEEHDHFKGGDVMILSC